MTWLGLCCISVMGQNGSPHQDGDPRVSQYIPFPAVISQRHVQIPYSEPGYYPQCRILLHAIGFPM